MKALFAAAVFSLCALTADAQVIYNSSGQPRSDRSDRNDKRESHFKKGEGFDASRIMYGGGIALGFGQGYFTGGLSPIVGYNITDNFSAGVGLGYRHFRLNDAYTFVDPQTGIRSYEPYIANLITPSIWTRYLVWRNLFVHAEAEYNSFSYNEWVFDNDQSSPTFNSYIKQRTSETAPALLVGLGIRQPLSEKVSIVTMLLLETLRDPKSPYAGGGGPGGFPIDLRFGINVNFGAPVW